MCQPLGAFAYGTSLTTSAHPSVSHLASRQTKEKRIPGWEGNLFGTLESQLRNFWTVTHPRAGTLCRAGGAVGCVMIDPKRY